MHAFSDLATAAYCPRKLYYRLRDGDRQVPDEVRARRSLAFRYPELADPDADLSSEPVAVTPTQYRTNLACARERIGAWPAIADPPARDVFLEGREARGVAHKVLEDPPAPSIVSAGEPPDEGAWRPQTVRAVAAAKALAGARETPVERAYVEYPAYGLVRELPLSTRRKAIYREAVTRAASVDGPPARLRDDAKCDPCEYGDTCGVKTRSLRSLLQP